MKRKIGIDIDDVLLDLIGSLVRFHNYNYGTFLTRGDFHTFYFNKVWGGTLKEAKAKVRDFFNSDFFNEMGVIPNSQKAINLLSKDYFLVNITSRLECVETATRNQINNLYPGVFKEIYFTDEWAGIGRKTKQEICIEERIDIFIDDSLDNVRECSYNGTKCLLFGNYNWNKCENKDLPQGVVRVKDWKEVLKGIEKLNYEN